MQKLLKKPSNTPSDLFEINAKPTLKKPNKPDDLFEACGKKSYPCKNCGRTPSPTCCIDAEDEKKKTKGTLGAETSYDEIMPVYI